MKRILALIAVVGLLSFGILASTASAASTSVVNRDIFRGSAWQRTRRTMVLTMRLHRP